jgi:NADPH:quinone reductase-like Zn-dependent oxidoreductase
VRYGPPDVLELRDVEKPVPDAGRVLVRVRASSLNASDWHGMRGGIVRLFGGGIWRPKDPRVGGDVSGIVEAVGPNVTRFKPGDEVFGAGAGALAEYVVAREDRLAPKPANVPFEQAGAVAVAATTALQGLRDRGHIRAGQKVLINGASGGVGTFALQIAKSYGAEVTAVCSPRNLDQARALGADHVIDYTREDFARNGQTYDLIYEVAAHHSISAYKRSLNPGGRCVIAGIGFPKFSIVRFFAMLILGPLRSRFGGKEVRFMGIAKLNEKDMAVLGDLLASGKVVSVIDRTYPLGQAAEAMRYLGTGHARGKVVVTVDHSAAS